jgi:hypothetical protein
MESGFQPLAVVDGLVAALAGFRVGVPVTEFGLSVSQWEQVRFDCSVAAGCTPEEATAGLVVLEGVRRSLDAATAVLAGRLNAGRDTRAALVRFGFVTWLGGVVVGRESVGCSFAAAGTHQNRVGRFVVAGC